MTNKKEELNKIISRVANLTDANDHNGARILIARDVINSPSFVHIFTSIRHIHAAMGYMDAYLMMFRNKITNKMLADVEIQYGKIVKDKVRAAL